MLKNTLIALSVNFIIIFTTTIAAPSHKITKLPEIGAVEIQLANGIKVNLKPIEESEEILVRGIAPGGYSVLSPKDRSSGKVSARIAWESGFGKWSCNEVSNKLLNDSLELETAVAPFHRTLDGAALPSKLEQLLVMIERLYSSPRFDTNAQAEVLSRLSESVKLRHRDPETLFEDVIRCTNTGDLAILHPITAEDLERVNFQTAKKYYLDHFLSTDDLVFLVVGEFDVDEVTPLVIKYLGAIPQRRAPATANSTTQLSVPSGLTKREVTSPFLQECMMRMTFALSLELTESSWQQLETTSQVIETRLRNRFREIMGATQGIDVAYEFPYYPSPDTAWLTIQFRSPQCKSDKLIDVIRQELARLQEAGPTREELEKVRLQQTRNDDFWLDSKGYWVQLLSNYYLWKFDPRNAIKDHNKSSHHEPELIRDFVKNHLDIRSYTTVLLIPE